MAVAPFADELLAERVPIIATLAAVLVPGTKVWSTLVAPQTGEPPPIASSRRGFTSPGAWRERRDSEADGSKPPQVRRYPVVRAI